MDHVGKAVRRLREERGLNQAQLAVSVGTGPSAISQIENGKRSPNSETLVKLARALQVEVADLFPPKAQAPLPLDSGEERGNYPYPWMSDTLETLISTWERQVEEQHNPAQSRTIMVAALDVQDAVTFNYRGRWEALSEQEKSERKELAGRLENLAMRGIDHYKESKKAEAAELEAVERRREEIRAATKRISA